MNGRADGVFSTQIRVYYEDTDVTGLVYHANYLKFLERCRSDWLRSLGCDVAVACERFQLIFAVHKASLEFLRPARLSDLLTVTVQVLRLGRASLLLNQEVIKEQSTICRGSVRLASLDATSSKPKSLPPSLFNLIEAASL